MRNIDKNPTKKSITKTHQRLSKLSRHGKLKKHTRDGMNSIAVRRNKDLIKMRENIEEDWVTDREALKAEEQDNDECLVPIDMLNADIDWENTPFKNQRKRLMKKLKMDEETKINDAKVPRKFKNVTEAKKTNTSLPTKVDGKLIYNEEENQAIEEEQQAPMDKEEEKNEEEGENEENKPKKGDKVDYSKYSSSQLLGLRKVELEKFKQHVSIASLSLISNPHENISKLDDLCRYAVGEKVESIIREDAQKIATASLTEILVDIIPGYYIRDHTEAETNQKMKKDMKSLFNFEKTLLDVYKRFLEHLGIFVRPMNLKNSKQIDRKAFDYCMGIICCKCLCKLIRRVPHFNYTPNLIKSIVRFAVYSCQEVSIECSAALADMFAADFHFNVSLCAAIEISSAVRDRKGNVPGRVLKALLQLNIREVSMRNDFDEKKVQHRLKEKKHAINKDKKSKSTAKYEKQLKKLEKELKEADSANVLSKKQKFATDTMKHVFTIYFSIVKKVNKGVLLEPVLEGLAKFAHLINVDFFDDLVHSLSNLVQDPDLRVMDALNCTLTVFVILSGEGCALNIDPIIFYKIFYNRMLNIPFYNQELQDKCIGISIRCLHIMFNLRRKMVPPIRVAAFIKRIFAICFLLSSKKVIALLAMVRTMFVAHRSMASLVENQDEDEFVDGLFRPDIKDPDCSHAMSTTFIPDLKKLIGHPHGQVGIFACHILAGCPSTGQDRLALHLVNRKPTDFLEDDSIKDVPSPYKEAIDKAAKKNGGTIVSENLQVIIEKWLMNRK
uniref:Nucleolar complex protein 3 homolog n=1 Tax=Rhabditophanes sp. KR3021 TaxID=114890 RepID=A0AC35UGU1_9BILA